MARPAARGRPADPDTERIMKRCEALGISWLRKAPDVEDQAVQCLTAEIAVQLRAVPIRIENGRLTVAMRDPLDIAAVDQISTLAGPAP